MNLHTELLDHITARFGERLQGAPQLTQDALALSLDNGVQLTIRYAATDAWVCRELYLKFDREGIMRPDAAAQNEPRSA